MDYSRDQPCLCKIKENHCLENDQMIISACHTAFAPLLSANFYFISGLNSPSRSVPCPRNSRGDV